MPCSVALTKAVSHSECGLLVGLKGELLGEHYVPKGKMPCRTEAPDGDLGTILTELFDIHVPAAANAIALPVWEPLTSKYPCLSSVALCSGQSHSLSNASARCSGLLSGMAMQSRRRLRSSARPNATLNSRKVSGILKLMPNSSPSTFTASTALEARKKDGLFGGGIEMADKLRTTVGRACRCREAGPG